MPDGYWDAVISASAERGHFLPEEVWRAMCVNALNPTAQTRKFAAAVKEHRFKEATEMVITGGIITGDPMGDPMDGAVK